MPKKGLLFEKKVVQLIITFDSHTKPGKVTKYAKKYAILLYIYMYNVNVLVVKA